MSSYGQQPGPHGSQPLGPSQPYGQQPYPGQPLYGQQPQGYPPQPPSARKPRLVRHSLPVVTMDKPVGQEITEVLGVVARSRELRPDLRTGNPVDGYATMLTWSRQDAVARLVEMAEAAGAHAVVGLRFDCSEITQSPSEVAAYGTAVRLAGAPSGPPPVPGRSGQGLVRRRHPRQDDAMSADDRSTPVDDMKAKFREALEAKKGRRGEDHLDAGQQPAHAHGPVETKRTFRRKTG